MLKPPADEEHVMRALASHTFVEYIEGLGRYVTIDVDEDDVIVRMSGTEGDSEKWVRVARYAKVRSDLPLSVTVTLPVSEELYRLISGGEIHGVSVETVKGGDISPEDPGHV